MTYCNVNQEEDETGILNRSRRQIRGIYDRIKKDSCRNFSFYLAF